MAANPQLALLYDVNRYNFFSNDFGVQYDVFVVKDHVYDNKNMIVVFFLFIKIVI